MRVGGLQTVGLGENPPSADGGCGQAAWVTVARAAVSGNHG